jgi:parvulin-like peptidyl-prolyl isomerase
VKHLQKSLAFLAVVALGVTGCSTDRSGLTGSKSSVGSSDFSTEVQGQVLAAADGYPIDSELIERVIDLNVNDAALLAELKLQGAGESANPWLTRAFRDEAEIDRAALRANFASQVISLTTLDARSLALGVSVTQEDRDDVTADELEAISSFFAPTTGATPETSTNVDGTPANAAEILTYEDLPDDLKEIIKDQAAKVRALDRVLAQDAASAPTRLADSFGDSARNRYCFRHILISSETLGDEGALAGAQEVRQQLVDGADFAELAATKSDDPGSASNGGSYGCQSQFELTQYVSEFAWGIRDATVGEVTEPVKTQFGYHLIKVDSLETLNDDEYVEAVDTNLAASAPTDATALFAYAGWALNAARGLTSYTITPEYGTLAYAQGTQVVIVPPGLTLDELLGNELPVVE